MSVSRIGRRHVGSGAAAAVLIWVSMPSATSAAGTCDDGNGTVVLTCDAHATEFRRQRLDRSLFTDVPLIQMTGRLEDRLGDLKADGAAPLAAMKGEDDTAVRASISQYRAWRAKQEAEIVERLRREIPRRI